MRTLSWRVHPKNSGSASMDYTIEECSLKVRKMQEPQEYVHPNSGFRGEETESLAG